MLSLRPSLFFCAVLLSAPLHGEDWIMFGRDPAHSNFNPAESALSPSNVSQLEAAWKISVGAPLASAVTVSNGVLYFGAWDGNFYAVDARDGHVLWMTFVGKAAQPAQPNCFPAIGVTSQATVAGNTVFVGGGDSAVYALDIHTGSQLWRVPIADPEEGAYLWSSLTLYNNALYVGISSLGDCPLVRGGLARIDLAAPHQPLIRYLVPEDELGAGIWSTPAIDEGTNTVFVTTGTGEQDAEEGIWGGTLMALDANTLEIKSHFFLPTNSLEDDIEWGSSPTLFTSPDGTPLVAATGKDGLLYTLRREDLLPQWTTPLAIQCVCPECGCGSISTPAFDGVRLYVGAGVSNPDEFEAGTIYSIDPATGAVLWSRRTYGTIIGAVTAANGLVFAASTGGLDIFDAATGDYLWNDGQYDALFSQAVVSNGTVFTTYLNGHVVAWRLPGF